MKRYSPLLMVGVLLLLLLSAMAEVSQSTKRARRSTSPCAPALCAEPGTDPGTGCQNNCERNDCLFRGCVNFGAFGPTWRPDPCTTCNCATLEGDQQSLCAVANCPPPQCYGYPMMRRPWSCCSTCNFNVSANECRAVPQRTTTVEVPMEGGGVCMQSVLEYSCDKSFVVEGAEWYGCDPVQENVTLSPEELSSQPGGVGVSGCGSAVTYERVTRCDKRRLSPFEIPQDYDPNPDSCSFVVENGAIVTTTETVTTGTVTTETVTTTTTTTTEDGGTQEQRTTDYIFVSSGAPPIATPLVSLTCATLLLCLGF